jgi:hypothetical protein
VSLNALIVGTSVHRGRHTFANSVDTDSQRWNTIFGGIMDGEAGKGDRYRKVDRKKYEKNWERIFKEECQKCCKFCDTKECEQRRYESTMETK